MNRSYGPLGRPNLPVPAFSPALGSCQWVCEVVSCMGILEMLALAGERAYAIEKRQRARVEFVRTFDIAHMGGVLEYMELRVGDFRHERVRIARIAQRIVAAGEDQRRDLDGRIVDVVALALIGGGLPERRAKAGRLRRLPGARQRGHFNTPLDIGVVLRVLRVVEYRLDDAPHVLARPVVGIEDLPAFVVGRLAAARTDGEASEGPVGPLARRDRQAETA